MATPFSELILSAVSKLILDAVKKRAALGLHEFEEIHAGRDYPEAIRHERLQSIYELVGPQIGDLLCKLTNAVDDWKYQKWREDYSRFDEISKNQRDLIEMMVATKKAPLQQSDALLYRMQRLGRITRQCWN